MKAIRKVLIIDDEASLRKALQLEFEKNNYQTVAIGSQKELLNLPSSLTFDLAIVDMILPDGNGIELISILKDRYPNIKINILTGHGSIDVAIQAMKKGAFHFFTKPFSINEILNVCQKALKQQELEQENKQLRACIRRQYSFQNIVGQSHAIIDLLKTLKKISQSDSTVLIQGESGTGKEMVSKAIHFNSSRSQKPFIPVHCGAIPHDLLESELFGHAKGAFTGAYKEHIGKFQVAHGGTLFLDEISTMPQSLQVKLLRVLQEKKVEPVGSSQTIACDVRVIAASNSNIEKEVKENKFRADLFYRLNVIPIHVPPLRERVGDISLLLKTFIQAMNKKHKYKISGVVSKVVQSLNAYSWPGNVRELENLVERLCVFKGQGTIEWEDLPNQYKKITTPPISEFQIPDEGVHFKDTVNQFENSLLLNALKKTNWNRHQAAHLLKMNRTTLIEKIKKRRLQPLE